jgi:alkanesulfonate monooxygenase SsuD/methylene tetrahydromethanopterin reductase-like flavin-dependent oxidoreductase (luciferase family)
MGQPGRPALSPFPLLARVAVEHPHLSVGPLVARVGLWPTAELLARFDALADVAPGRVIAAIGTGDRLSEAENHAFGLPYGPASERRTMLEVVGRSLASRVEVWIGAGAPATNALARALGVTLNFWNVQTSVITQNASDGPTSWAGDAKDDVRARLEGLAAAGATWAVFSPTTDLEQLASWRGASGHLQ